MAFQVSPGVEVKEIDLTNVVPAVSTSIGAVAGAFRWGPVEEVVQVGSEKQLLDRFFTPNADTFKYFAPAAQFLQYANDLRVVRTANDGQANASQVSGVLVKNQDDYDNQVFASDVQYIAKFPGDLGNSIGVEVVTNETAFESTDFAFSDLFDFAPGTTEWAATRGVSDDELHVVVFDADGRFTGTPGEVLEVFSGLSQAFDARAPEGGSNYYVNVLNNQSRFIWFGSHDPALTEAGSRSDDVSSFTTTDDVLGYEFDNGSDGTSTEPSLGELTTAYDLFDDAETLDVSFIIGAQVEEGDDVTLANHLIGIAEGRRDAIAFVSPAVTRTISNVDAVQDVKDWADQITSSSYGVLDSSALFVFDKFNDAFRYTVAAGSIAGLSAFTDSVADPWFSPAGLNRGQLRGVTKLAFNPRQNERDTLYKARVNPIVSFPGEGIVLFGDKTALARPSAFDRINVRRLFIVLQKAIATAARFQLFELNDQFTRAQFRNLVEPFLRDVQGRRGMTDFLVVCDETNNTPEVVDTNRFVADIYIKPARSINFITLNFIAVRTGVEFSEIAGQ